MPARKPLESESRPRQKYYFDAGHVEIAAHLVYELDPDGKQLRVVKFTDYVSEKVRTLYASAAELRKRWADPEQRASILSLLEERGLSFDTLRDITNQNLAPYCGAMNNRASGCGSLSRSKQTVLLSLASTPGVLPWYWTNHPLR